MVSSVMIRSSYVSCFGGFRQFCQLGQLGQVGQLGRLGKFRQCSPYRKGQQSSTLVVALESSAVVDGVGEVPHRYDVVVVGGGHAGCEAAAASARVGARTLLVTQRLDTIGELSCNPSIGGIGKGHLVREIDALGGMMSVVADAAGIHYRLLNRRKGPAVRGPRAQMDRDLYKQAMQRELLQDRSAYPNLFVLEGSVQDLLLEERRTVELDERARVRGVLVEVSPARGLAEKAEKRVVEVSSDAVVVTTGTFLRGVLMMGSERYEGGRHLRDSEQVEPASTAMALTLARFGFPLGRLKTGTPARLDGATIDYSRCVVQPTDDPVQPFSHLLQYRGELPACIASGSTINCYQTSTNERTHELVLRYEHTLPRYDGDDGKGNGPRYCPSIFKKVQRFPDRSSHNTFLEPEGLNTPLVYPNGMSGPYPPEIQQEILRTMRGLEEVCIVRPGYDVEYDFVNPKGTLKHTLETRAIAGLYLAGQICGTTGYEEAGAQGIVAGANAGKLATSSADPFIVGRDEGYIGVLIDDLVTRGTTEPYRMFTSRSEYRISLRADNADLRLTAKGIQHGLVRDEERIAALTARQYHLHTALEGLRSFSLPVREWAERSSAGQGGQSSQANHENNSNHDNHDDNSNHDNHDDNSNHDNHDDNSNHDNHDDNSNHDNHDNNPNNPSHDSHDGHDNTDKDSAMQPLQRIGGDRMDIKGSNRKTAEDVLLMPHVTLKEVQRVMMAVQSEPQQQSVHNVAAVPAFVADTLEATVKYSSYLRRQDRDMQSWRKAQGRLIPPDIVYDRNNFPTLCAEELEKLHNIRPSTFAEASAISGMTPNSLVYLYHHVNNRSKQRDRKRADTANGLSQTTESLL